MCSEWIGGAHEVMLFREMEKNERKDLTTKNYEWFQMVQNSGTLSQIISPMGSKFCSEMRYPPKAFLLTIDRRG